MQKQVLKTPSDRGMTQARKPILTWTPKKKETVSSTQSRAEVVASVNHRSKKVANKKPEMNFPLINHQSKKVENTEAATNFPQTKRTQPSKKLRRQTWRKH